MTMQPSLSGKRVLVTGGSGVIGRELLARLSGAQACVLSIDREPPPVGTWPGIQFVRRDLSSGNLEELRAFRPQIVLHLAASFERSEESADFWDVNWRDNLVASHRPIDLLGRLGSVERVVFASSYLIYSPRLYLCRRPPTQPVRLGEDAPVSPRNLCGAAKFYIEHALQSAGQFAAHPWRSVHARIFRVYGCGSRDVVSRWIRAGLRREPIEVFGRENRFDYIFAGDVAEGLLRLADSPRAEGVVNLGMGRSRRIGEVLEALRSAGLEPKVIDRADAEPDRYEASCAEMTRLAESTGWLPQTSLEDGVARVARFEEAALEGAHVG